MTQTTALYWGQQLGIGYDLILQAVYVKSLGRHGNRSSIGLELRPQRGRCPMTLPSILLPSTILQSDWFQALALFVAINTLSYASLSLAKLLPRRRN